MTAPESVNPAGLLREHLESASPDLLRAMIKTFAAALMSAEADAACGAEYGQRSERAGTVELAIPMLRSGSYFPDWLPAHRRRAEQALTTAPAAMVAGSHDVSR